MRTVATQWNSIDGIGKAEAWHGDVTRGYAKEVNSTDRSGKAEAEQRKAKQGKRIIFGPKKQDFERR